MNKMSSEPEIEFGASMNEEPNTIHSIHPNPFDELIHIESEEVGTFELESSSGNIVLRGEVEIRRQ